MSDQTSQADARTLAILLAGLEASPREIPKAWKVNADRLVRDGKARITSTARVYRTSQDGRTEIARLQRLGVTPLPLYASAPSAHEGRPTTQGDDHRRPKRAGGSRG